MMQQNFTATFRVCFRASLCGICGDQSGIGTCFFFLRVSRSRSVRKFHHFDHENSTLTEGYGRTYLPFNINFVPSVIWKNQEMELRSLFSCDSKMTAVQVTKPPLRVVKDRYFI